MDISILQSFSLLSIFFDEIIIEITSNSSIWLVCFIIFDDKMIDSPHIFQGRQGILKGGAHISKIINFQTILMNIEQ